jgi:glycosyltransferase involved in cell wall biosynthesis
MKHYDIIFWGKTSFDQPLKLTALNMAESLAQYNRVLYMEPSIGLFRLILSKFGFFNNYFSFATEVKRNLFVHKPFFILPFSRLRLVKRVNQAFVLWRIKKAIIKLKFGKYINWFWKYEDFVFIEKLGNHFSVFEFTDDQSLFPVFKNEMERNTFKTERDRIIKKADIVFTNSPIFRNELKTLNQQTFYYPHGTQVDHFRKSLLETTEIPRDIDAIQKPIVGWIGALDAFRLDFDLISHIARKRPDYSFVFIGRIGVVDTTKMDDLPKAKNIFYLGYRSFYTLPGYIKAFDVCIIPNDTSSPYIRANQPMKFFEFLAAGKPIVTTDIPSLKEFEDVAFISKNKEDFLKNIDLALSEETDVCSGKRLDRGRELTWYNRVNKMLQKLRKYGA